MGNLCGKESSPSSFNSTGRVLGSAPNAPPASARASVPSKPKIASPGKTLGSSSPSSSTMDARTAAAQAAEARNATQSKGKLGSQLENNKKTTLKQQMLNEAQQKKVQQEQLVWD